MGRKALPLPGEAREDWAIIVDLANRLGLDWTYAHPREVFAEMTQAMPSLANITWERLERENSVTYPCDAPDQPGHDIVFGDGFPTASGRGRLRAGGDIVPPAEEPDAEYPMVLTTGRQLEHWHTGSMTRRASVLDDLEPEAVAYVSPADLRRLGPQGRRPDAGATRRGAIELKARVDGAIPTGLIFIPFAYAEAAANVLTNPAARPVRQDPGVQVLRMGGPRFSRNAMSASTAAPGAGMSASRPSSAAAGFLKTRNIVDLARPRMRQLMDQASETVNLAIIENHEVVYLAQVECHQMMRALAPPGSRLPLHCSAAGKALLARMAPQYVKNLMEQRGMQRFTAATLTTLEALEADLELIRTGRMRSTTRSTRSGCAAWPRRSMTSAPRRLGRFRCRGRKRG